MFDMRRGFDAAKPSSARHIFVTSSSVANVSTGTTIVLGSRLTKTTRRISKVIER